MARREVVVRDGSGLAVNPDSLPHVHSIRDALPLLPPIYKETGIVPHPARWFGSPSLGIIGYENDEWAARYVTRNEQFQNKIGYGLGSAERSMLTFPNHEYGAQLAELYAIIAIYSKAFVVSESEANALIIPFLEGLNEEPLQEISHFSPALLENMRESTKDSSLTIGFNFAAHSINRAHACVLPAYHPIDAEWGISYPVHTAVREGQVTQDGVIVGGGSTGPVLAPLYSYGKDVEHAQYQILLGEARGIKTDLFFVDGQVFIQPRRNDVPLIQPLACGTPWLLSLEVLGYCLIPPQTREWVKLQAEPEQAEQLWVEQFWQQIHDTTLSRAEWEAILKKNA